MSEYDDLDAQLRAWLDDDQHAAEVAEHAFMYFDTDAPEAVEHYRRCDPTRVLADIAGKRALLDHLASWQHDLVDGDWWFSCSQAALPDNDTPGSGCADENRRGEPCDCGLDKRRLAVLRCVAAGYVGRPGFKPEWRLM